jgi:hypothetical protein
MKSGSKTSSGRWAPKTSHPWPGKYPFATSNTRGRKREARRWLDVLAARCTNGARCANPVTVYESARIHETAFADLEACDKTLFDAVHQCMWDRTVAEQGITMERWRVLAIRRARRINKIRAALV